MAYKFNPFTGKLDEVGAGGATAAGSANEIQYNDGAGGLAASSDFTVDPDWNDAAVTFTGLKLNVTDGAGGSPVGAAGSNLLDLQSGGTSKFRVNNSGTIINSGGGQLQVAGVNGWYFSSTVYLGNNLSLSTLSGTSTVFLERDANDTLAQRRGTNAQTYRLYNTYANGGVDFERLSFNWDTNVFKITSEAGGTGTVRGIQLGSAATEPVALFGATPVVQPTTAVGSATVAGGGGNAVNESTTFNGYTLAQVVQALQNLGILA